MLVRSLFSLFSLLRKFFNYFVVFYYLMADCVFCAIAQGKVQSFKVYEDEAVVAFLDINPATKGQVVLTTKKHVQGIHELSPAEVGQLFSAARLILIGMSQSLGCGGANITYALGELAGQRTDHLLVYIIPRYEGDKVVIDWERKQGNPQELKGVAETLGKAIKSIPTVVTAPKPVVIEEKKEAEEEVIESEPRVPLY